jgi:hypothetical protein
MPSALSVPCQASVHWAPAAYTRDSGYGNFAHSLGLCKAASATAFLLGGGAHIQCQNTTEDCKKRFHLRQYISQILRVPKIS